MRAQRFRKRLFMKLFWTVTALSMMALGSFACKNRDDGSSELNVVNGEELNPKNPGFYTAVSLLTKNASVDSGYIQYCSGALVAPGLIVTSAQCQTKAPLTYIKYDDSNTYDKLGEQKMAHRHPLYSGDYYFDLAWIKPEKTSALTPDKIIPVMEDPSALMNVSQIEEAIVVGGGINGTEDVGKRYFTNVEIEEFKNNDVGRAMIKAKSKDGSVCFGDNGGPLYIKTAGKWYLAGVLHGYHKKNAFDHRDTGSGSGGELPNSVDLCAKENSLLFTYLGYHQNWVRASSTASDPEIVEIKFKSNENFGSNFMAWCQAKDKSDLAWVSVRLGLDALQVNTCEEAAKKLTDSKKLSLELGSLRVAHPTVLKSMMSFASDKVETLELRQYYDDRHRLGDFLSEIRTYTKLKTLKIENFVGFKSYDFLKSIPTQVANRIEVFHFLPSVAPSYESNAPGRPDTEVILLERLPNLRELHLAYNGIDQIKFLSKMPRLEVLNLDFNNVRDYSPLLGAKKLKSLSMVSNPLDATKLEADLKAQLPQVQYNIGNGN